jgi:hypothetical protein
MKMKIILLTDEIFNLFGARASNNGREMMIHGESKNKMSAQTF